MPKFKISNETFWLIFKQCVGLEISVILKIDYKER